MALSLELAQSTDKGQSGRLAALLGSCLRNSLRLSRITGLMNMRLKYFETQPSLSSRQTRWWEYLSCLNFIVKHVAGPTNWVADCLSCYYETDGPDDQHPACEFVSADAWLDPDMETLPVQWYV